MPNIVFFYFSNFAWQYSLFNFRFITRKDAPKISEIKNHSQVNVSFSNPNNAAYVSISGRAEVIQDKEKAKELWNPYLKSW